MKKTSTMIRTGLVALLLSATASVFGQSIDKTGEGADIQVGPSTAADNAARIAALGAGALTDENRDVILFYNDASRPGLTLVASRTEDLTIFTPAPNRMAANFTHYRWFYMGADGTAAVDGTVFATGLDENGLLNTYVNAGDEKLVIRNLTEGYHYFKVQGIVNPDNIEDEELCNIQEETYVVYVLPRLSVSATGSTTLVSGGDTPTPLFQFCETDGAQDNVTIATNYSFLNETLPADPTSADFDVKYRWYAVKQDGTAWPDVSTIATDPVSIEGVTILTPTPLNATGGTLPSFAPQISTFGNYKIFVEVEYAVKDRNYSAADANDIRIRPHVIYRGFAQVDGADMILTVTPAPGKPHITIENIQD